MTVPDYQTLMAPLLNSLADHEVRHASEVRELVAQRMNISDNDRTELTPAGNKSRFDDRFGWAATYMRQAGLLASVSRGYWQITDRGLQVLKDHPNNIDNAILRQFPEFQAFQQRKRIFSEESNNELEFVVSSQTPDDLIQQGYEVARQALASDLHQRIIEAPPEFFEQLVVDLLVAMGYGGSRSEAGRAIGRPGDGGIDGVIDEDRLGLDSIYLQAKRWQGSVGSSTVNEFIGSVMQRGARKGVLLTTSTFTPAAESAAKGPHGIRIILIDGKRLTDLMIEYGVGVSEKARYVIMKIDEDYFAGE